MRIKKFNESTGETIEVHCVITNDSAGYIIEDECKCFYEKMKAADYLIKEINRVHNTVYEPFYDSDGNRFFTFLNENDDLERCLAFLEENNIDINIISVPLIK
jgi:hypothetical protein